MIRGLSTSGGGSASRVGMHTGGVCIQGILRNGRVLHPGGICRPPAGYYGMWSTSGGSASRGFCEMGGFCIQEAFADPPRDTTGCGQRAGGAHPTGMHSCFVIISDDHAKYPACRRVHVRTTCSRETLSCFFLVWRKACRLYHT